MNKKMMKRSLALGALMAFVITGSAMAADESYGSTMLDKDVTITGGNLTYTADDSSANNSLGELNDKGQVVKDKRSFGLAVIDGGSHTITLDEGKTLYIKNSLEGTDRNYGIVSSANKKANSLTVNGNVEIKVAGIGTQNVRGIRNAGTNGTMVFNGDVHIVADIKNPSNGGYITGVDTWSGSKTYFNGNTVIDINSGKGETISWSNVWANALQLNQGGYIAFSGEKCIMNVSNNGYTAQSVNLAGNTDIVEFNSNETIITSKSDYGVNGIAGYGKALFSGKDVTINSYLTSGVTNANAVGIMTSIDVENTVDSFTINVEGSGKDLANPGASIGTGGIISRGEDMNIAAKKLNISLIAGQDTQNIKFNKEKADELTKEYEKYYKDNALYKDYIDSGKIDFGGTFYATTYGLYCHGTNHWINDDSIGVINIDKVTSTVIKVDDKYKAGVGVCASTYYDLGYPDDIWGYHPGTINILGDADISAVGKEGAKALYARNGGTINVGSEGKTLNFVGDIVSHGRYDVEETFKEEHVSIHKVSTINLHGNSVFDGTKTQFIATDGGLINLAGGNMSGVLNIAKDSKVNLTGATFTANDLATGIVGGGKLVLTDSGVLSTTANQIFTKADTVGTDFVDNAITDIANEKVDFVSGTVSLTDKEYNFDFVQSAVDTMQKHNSSKTSVVMTGTLVGGVEDNNITVDQAAGLGGDVALDKVTAEADGNLLVGSTKADGDKVEEIEIKDSVANGFNVGSLELAAGSNGMVITNAQEVTLGGSDGGSVITVEKDAEAKVNVVVGTDKVVDGASKTNGTLNIGNALANADTKYTLNGSVIVNNDSTLNTKGNTTITGDIELNNGTVNAVNGSLDVKFITVMEGDNNTITGSVYASALSVDKDDVVINIGNDKLAGNVVVEDANLNGAVVFLDPAFVNGIEDSSKLAVKNSSDLNGHYVAGQNSVMSFGVDNTADADKMFAKTGLEWKNDVTAAAYVAGNTNVANGSVVVNGSLTSAPAALANGTVSFADKSLLMVDGSKIKDTAALSGVTSAAIDQDSAKLYIDGAKKGETYHVIAGVDAGWADKNIISDNSLLEFKGDTETNSKYDVTASLKKVNDVYGNKVIIANVVDNTLDKHDTIAAADFFNAAVSSKNNASKDAQISALNSAGAMSELAGVAHSTYAVSNILTDTVADHVSMSNELDHDSDIWAHYVHNKENVKGLSVANFGADYDAQYNGIVVGGDFYKKDNVVAGAALTYVDGNINGSSLAARTENDAEYYGVSVYGSVTNDDNAVIGDISYLHGKNEITQHNSGFALTGEPESDAFSVGVRVEKAIETEAGKFVPYAGVRYMHVGTGNYTNSIGMSYDADDANLFLLPVGLKYSAEAKVGGMTIRPVAEVGYVWAMGDTDSAQTVSLNGAADGFGYDVTDEGSYFARIGVEAVSDNVTYGLGYEYQKGDSVKANKWMANLNFSF